MQAFTKLLALTLFCGLISQSGTGSAAAQTTSQTQKQRWNERPPTYRFPQIPRDGSEPVLSESRAEITNRTASAAKDSNTTLIGRWIGGPCNAVAVAGNRAYFSNGPYLMIADVSDPNKPTELGRILMPRSRLVRDLAVNGNLVYVAAGEGGLRIIDVSDPANPTEIGFLVTSGWGADVAVNGNYAYVAGEGLRIIDVSDPANPVEVGSLHTGRFFGGVATKGGVAYVSEENEGLRIIDVSDPANPSELGFFDTVELTDPCCPIDFAFDVAVSGDFAYIADSIDGVRIIDVSDPANPTEVGFLITIIVWLALTGRSEV